MEYATSGRARTFVRHLLGQKQEPFRRTMTHHQHQHHHHRWGCSSRTRAQRHLVKPGASPGSLLQVSPAARRHRRGCRINEEAVGGGRGRGAPAGLATVAGPVQGVLRKGRRAAEGSAIPRQVGRRASGEGGRVALAEHFRHGVPRISILTGIVDGD